MSSVAVFQAISTFILIFACASLVYVTLGRIVRTNSEIESCPSSQTGDVTFLMHGSPPLCYVSGFQGPCGPSQVLGPKLQDSKYGVCISGKVNLQRNNSLPKDQDPFSGNKISTDATLITLPSLNLQNSDDLQRLEQHRLEELHWEPQFRSLSVNLKRNDCRSGETYSILLQKCIDGARAIWGGHQLG